MPMELATDPLESDAPAAPRSQAGSSPQHLLVTLLGDYWMRHEEPLASAALVALLEEFGVTVAGARAAISRLGRRGVLESVREGRRTFYRLNDAVGRRLIVGGSRILSFGNGPDWNGEWTIVAFSLPEDQRDVRHLLRSRLRWLGFASLYDGVWISARADAQATSQALAEMEITTVTVFNATQVPQLGGRAPIEAWDLDMVRAAYAEFLSMGEPMLEMLADGRATPRASLAARTTLMDTYRRIPSLDPGLPEALMPANWPRAEARSLFVELYDALAPLAVERVRVIISQFDTRAAELIRPLLTTDLLGGAQAHSSHF